MPLKAFGNLCLFSLTAQKEQCGGKSREGQFFIDILHRMKFFSKEFLNLIDMSFYQCINLDYEKAKLIVRSGRNVTGLNKIAGLPL